MIRHFISFPKSGRSWIRYALLQMQAGQDMVFHHDGFEFNDGQCPPLNFDIRLRLQIYAPVQRLVYLERDPRDLMCSFYHQITGRFRDFFNYQGNISEFIRHPYFGAHNLLQFRQIWHEIGQHRPVYRVSYEEMTDNPFCTLQGITRFLEYPVNAETIHAAVEASHFSRMQSVEQSASFDGNWLKPRNGSPKVRQGKVAAYKNQLCPEDIDYLNALFRLD